MKYNGIIIVRWGKDSRISLIIFMSLRTHNKVLNRLTLHGYKPVTHYITKFWTVLLCKTTNQLPTT